MTQVGVSKFLQGRKNRKRSQESSRHRGRKDDLLGAGEAMNDGGKADLCSLLQIRYAVEK